MINFREGWRGHLWQGRFSSFPMNEVYLLVATRYIEMNPVHAGLVPDAESWPWSSVRAHLAGEDDELVRVNPLLGIVGNWREFLGRVSEEEFKKIRKHERTGSPLGGEGFMRRLESLLGRCLSPQKTGPKVKHN